MPIDPTQVEAIFAEAVGMSDAAARAAYLETACGGDELLRQRVVELLAAHDDPTSFLKLRTDSKSPSPLGPLSERPGSTIGHYKLLEQIGEGGFGVVFMAEQKTPVARMVALKIIKPGMDTQHVIARFEAERQALAMMDHPNIAKVYDAGATDAGRPYFVMELVKGVPITNYCDEKHLPLRQRLELFLNVCKAVQHAHQKGVIHRDIKPTNVLVAEYDNHAVPKVIDFGVAKATAQKLTERTMFTAFGQVVGTVEYMSPEQAKLNQLDIDTRSDIYSMGVLLYELLTGSTPFEQKRLREAAFDEMLRIIREEDPPKPSTKLSSSQTLPSIAANRHTEPARLTKEVRGELDWIVMKALDKDRNRRYETANALAHDLEHYLADEPVQAGPPSLAYRLRKFVKRKKRAVATGVVLGMVTLGAIAATAGSIGWAIRDRQAREGVIEEHAVQAIEIAENSLSKGDMGEASTFMQQAEAVLATSVPRPEVRDRFREDQKLLSQLGAEYDLANQFNQYKVEDIYFVNAELEVKCREMARLLPKHALIPAYLAENLALQGKLTDAEKFARHAVRLDPDEAWAHHCLAFVLVKQGKLDEAIEHYRTSLQVQKDWHEHISARFDDRVRNHRLGNQRHSDRAQTHIELAWALRQADRTPEAEQEFKEARRDEYFSSPQYTGNYFALQGRLLEAGTHYLEAFRRNRNDSELAMRAACSMLQAGDRKEYESICQWMLERFGKTDDTSAACRTCFACLASSEPVGDLDELLRLANAGDGIPHQMACRARALVAYRAGNWEESLKWSASSRRAAAENTTMGRHYVMQSRILEALALHRLGKSAEANKAYEEATKIAREIFPDAPLYLNSAGYNDDWIEWVLYEPLHQEAKALVPLSPAVSLLELAGGSAAGVRQAIAQAKSLSWDGMEPRDLLICGELLLLGDEFEKAADALTQAVARGGKEPSYFKSLGWALLRAGKKEEAIAALTKAMQGLDHDQLVAKGEPDNWTAAYLLGRVDEAEYDKHWRNQSTRGGQFGALPSFYIGQKMEADGNVQKAVSAYRQSVELSCGFHTHYGFIMEEWTGTADELASAFCGSPYGESSPTWAAYRLSELAHNSEPAPR